MREPTDHPTVRDFDAGAPLLLQSYQETCQRMRDDSRWTHLYPPHRFNQYLKEQERREWEFKLHAEMKIWAFRISSGFSFFLSILSARLVWSSLDWSWLFVFIYSCHFLGQLSLQICGRNVIFCIHYKVHRNEVLTAK